MILLENHKNIDKTLMIHTHSPVFTQTMKLRMILYLFSTKVTSLVAIKGSSINSFVIHHGNPTDLYTHYLQEITIENIASEELI